MRGAAGNSRPYRDLKSALQFYSLLVFFLDLVDEAGFAAVDFVDADFVDGVFGFAEDLDFAVDFDFAADFAPDAAPSFLRSSLSFLRCVVESAFSISLACAASSFANSASSSWILSR